MPHVQPYVTKTLTESEKIDGQVILKNVIVTMLDCVTSSKFTYLENLYIRSLLRVLAIGASLSEPQ